MFRFEYIQYLYLLGGIPIITALLYLGYKYDAHRRDMVGESSLIDRLMPTSDVNRKILRDILLVLGLILVIVAAANPQWGTKKEKIKATSADIFIALDISQSMMASDVAPSRLDRAKRFVEKLIKKLKGDRIGLVFFAGDAYLQMPLTMDYAAAVLMVKSAHPNMAGTQGTRIDEVINLTMKAFDEDTNHQRAVIIVSDGEDHDENSIAAIEKARDHGLVVYTVGVGTEKGAFVPFTDRNGRLVFKKDDEGKPVISKLNIPYLQELAAKGGGEFYLVNQGEEAIDDIKTKMKRLQRREIEQYSFSEYNSYYQWFLLPGFLLLAGYVFLPKGKNKDQ